MVTLPPPPSWPPPKEVPRRPRIGPLGLVIAVAVMALCAGLVAAGYGIAQRLDTRSGGPADPASPTATPRRSPTPALEAAIATVSGGPETSFNLPVGTAAQFTDRDGTWTVALLGVEWFDDCEDFLGAVGRMVVLDIRYEVLDGAVSIVPLTDFGYVAAEGSAGAGFFAGCADPPLDYTLVSAGATSRGKIAFSVPSGAGGVLTYGQFSAPTGSWVVSGA